VPERPTGLGPGDLLTVSEAARAMRMREAEARSWLRGEGLVRHLAGRERVIWGDVLARLRAVDLEGEARQEDRRKGSLPCYLPS
jgi:hypothetical protein